MNGGSGGKWGTRVDLHVGRSGQASFENVTREAARGDMRELVEEQNTESGEEILKENEAGTFQLAVQ